MSGCLLKALRELYRAMWNRPPFQVGDLVRFRPDARALGWTQDLEGLYPGYIGRVTRLVRSHYGDWDVYVDNKSIGFFSTYFELVRKADEPAREQD